MSEVAATGIEQLYPGVCSEGYIIFPHAHLYGDTCRYRRGQTLYSSLMGAFLGPKDAGEQRWKPTFYVLLVTYHLLLWHTGFCAT